MKKFNNKGFTLIELLAVIVILAVIALIATPIIMNVINDAKKGSAQDAMYGYVKAVELASTKLVTATSEAVDGVYKVSSGNLVMDAETLKVNFKGNKPKDNGYVILEKGQVIDAGLEFDGYCIKYNKGKAEVSDDCSAPRGTYEIGTEVYFDPTGAVANCASGKEWTPTNTEATCYKWNVIKDSEDNVEMLLDHDITYSGWARPDDSKECAEFAPDDVGGTIWCNATGPQEARYSLDVYTSSWSKVETLTVEDNVERESWNSRYLIRYAGMKARLISGQEIADIVKDTNWTTNWGFISISAHPWLYQNIDDFWWGYWTDTAVSNDFGSAWVVQKDGSLSSYGLNGFIGIRPVVRVLKSNL